MIQKLQYYISLTNDPYINLATEKHLLDIVDADTYILYLWQNENTVVIGKNQNAWAECRINALEESGGKLARRLSGGGAVYHDLGNLNFTFLCSKENYTLDKQMQVIQTACRLAGIETVLSGRNDLLADGKKFSGNAFYNSGGKAYHHGTLLIDADLEKMQQFLTPAKAKLAAKGVASVRARVTNLKTFAPQLTCEQMKAHMLAAFEKVYCLKASPLTLGDTKETNELAKTYASRDFLFGKTLPFTASAKSHFDWGNAELHLDIKKGIIQTATLYTDSLDETISERVCTALSGCALDTDATRKALSAVLSQPQSEDIYILLNQIL